MEKTPVPVLRTIVGDEHVRVDQPSREAYGTDALKRGHPADAVVFPATTSEVAAIARLCNETRTPLVPRGGGTGYTGGSVPVRGGVVISLERMNRIVEIDEANLLAIVEPNVITGDLQDAVERMGLFYPPDPASLRQSVIGGNVAECAGGPRAFKYGVTRQYVLGLEAVLPTGEVIRTGGKTVKNVVGYDLTHLLVGSEGTLAIITQIILRLIPKPPVEATIRATFPSVAHAVDAVARLVRARVIPAALEVVDAECLSAVARHLGGGALAPAGTAALLLIEVDGLSELVRGESERAEQACREAGATELLRAANEDESRELWRVRRELSFALRMISPIKFNHDVVVPKGRIPELFDLVDGLKTRYRLTIPCFGHVGDGNIHVNIMPPAGDDAALARALDAEGELFKGVVALEGSITGEHGIGFMKAKYLGLELTPETIALMKRVKQAFDPNGILNPGKIFDDVPVPELRSST
ncbi:MAG TPA: FAD-linked oxidase C-terminal domain-containing protein [Vicinamibacterales bacterium]|nr:FAD-linked oxidase C-terminal domain-containing protein [Vicinamibacterales bacterium]